MGNGALVSASEKLRQRTGLGTHWGGNSQMLAGSLSALVSSHRNGADMTSAPSERTSSTVARPTRSARRAAPRAAARATEARISAGLLVVDQPPDVAEDQQREAEHYEE